MGCKASVQWSRPWWAHGFVAESLQVLSLGLRAKGLLLGLLPPSGLLLRELLIEIFRACCSCWWSRPERWPDSKQQLFGTQGVAENEGPNREHDPRNDFNKRFLIATINDNILITTPERCPKNLGLQQRHIGSFRNLAWFASLAPRVPWRPLVQSDTRNSWAFK